MRPRSASTSTSPGRFGPADQLDHQVDPAALGAFQHPRREVLDVHRVGAERPNEVGGAERSAPRPARARPSAAAICTAAVPTAPDDPWISTVSPDRSSPCVVRASWAVMKTSGIAAASLLVDRVGHARHAAFVHGDPRGETAARHEAEHAVPGRPEPDALARSRHRARDLEARHVGHHPRRRRIAPLPLLHVGGVQPRERHVDEHLVGPDRRIVAIDDLDHVVAAGAGERHRPHAAAVASIERTVSIAGASRSTWSSTSARLSSPSTNRSYGRSPTVAVRASMSRCSGAAPSPG